MRNKSSRAWFALLAALALVVSACGEDEPDTPEGEPEEEPTEDETDDTDDTDDTDEVDEEETATDWEPERDVTVTVPFNPGGGADTSQRTWNDHAQPLLDVSLNVENREGAGGVTGWGQVMQSDPDGHNITIATPPFNVLPKVMDPEAVPYEHEDFTYICIYGVVPGALFVPEDSEWESVDDFVASAEENPGGITVAVSGAAGAEALLTYMLMSDADIDLTMVPFDGGAESVTATRGGTTDAMFGSTTYIPEQEGELRALAVARASDEDAEFPEVPSFTEVGYDVVQERYRAIAGPPDMDEGAIQFWSDICEQVVDDEDFRQAAEDTGNPAPPSFIGPDEATELIMSMVDDVEQTVEEFDIEEEEE